MNKDKIFRYPGAHSFLTTQKDIFFGREKDIEQFVKFIGLNQISVLFSKSGLGKSSLLNAGIIPFFLAQPGYRPVYIRFKAVNEQQEETPTYILRRNIVKDRFEETYLDKLINNEPTLWHDVKEQQIVKDNESIILLFDQFEELFDYPDSMIYEFKKQLAEVLFTVLPQRYRNKLNELNEGELTPEQLEILYTIPPIKCVFSIRNDRMHLLNNLSDFFPTILRNCYELKPLDREQAEDAIVNPTLIKDDKFFSPVFTYTYEAVDKIINYLTKNGKNAIESFQLQVLCHAIELKVKEQGITEIYESSLNNLDEISQNYYYNQLATISEETQRLAARKFIEDGLIFEQDKKRVSLYEGIIERDYGIDNSLLQKLINSRLVRSELLHDGGYVYELSHDSLIAPILKAKEARKDVEEKESLRQAVIEAEKKEKLASAAQQRNWVIALGAMILAGLAVFWGYQSFIHKSALKIFIGDYLVESVQSDINHLNYEVALSKLNKRYLPYLNDSALNNFLEVGYFYETARDTNLLLFDSVTKSLNYNRTFDSAFLEKMKIKYYPYFVDIGGSNYTFSHTEITCFQYNVFCKSTKRYIEKTASNWGLKGDYPVVKVDWYDAIEYANWLSKQDSLEPYYKINKETYEEKDISGKIKYVDNPDKNKWEVKFNKESGGYKLPTFKEWQMAAKGSKRYTYAGGDSLDTVGWYLENSKKNNVLEPSAVAQKTPNEFGLYDMSGNVWEWCEDKVLASDCEGVDDNRITAGGAFNLDAGGCTTDAKDCSYAYYPDNSVYNTIGFRLCRIKPAKGKEKEQ